MKKDKTMYKSTFLKGAFIATLGIVITKLLGVLYVIPFHAIIGEKGGALYGYAYTIYLVFISISSAGIPLAMSRIVSEYQTLGYHNAKKRAFALGKRIALLLGVVCFLFLSLCAPLIAKSILGDITGGNTIKDVVFVIRIISTAILVVPILSIYRGYFEGHRFMSPPSISQVIEQLARIFVIVFGSFMTLKVFKLSLTTTVGIAVFACSFGAFISYIYLVKKLSNNKKKFNEKIRSVNEPIITNKQIIKKIFIYAIPFIMIDIFKALYSYIDMVTVVKALVNYAGYSVNDAESIMSMLSTWASKFNMIILSVSTGVIVSLIPNLTKSVVENDQKDINKKINQTLSVLCYLMIPMTIGISFLSDSIWNLFYGSSEYGSRVLSYYIFVGLISGLFTAIITIVQTLKDYKTVFISLIVGLLIKFLLNTKLIIAFCKMGAPAYYGIITASILGYLTSFIICLIVLRVKYKINYEESIKNFFDIMCYTMVMMIVLYIIKFFIPVYSDIRIYNLFIIMCYSIIGALIYFGLTYKNRVIKNIFGKKISDYLKKITSSN